MAQQAAAKASTATVVWVKFCQVKPGPYGTGHPIVHGTCDATRNPPAEIQSETAGIQARSNGGRERSPRAAQAITEAPTTMRSRAASNHFAVDIPLAPSSLT
ncbi:MAG: hypothetical protein JWN80_1571 [Microbacteriaceae bacterium]|jgi:hypothetical protein|nr:hypothetical protein [Microbacteriaceae bacterium]